MDAYSKTAIVIPTYNEKDNIKKLIEAIFAISSDMKIIIVDDNSPDGTGEIVDALKKKYKNLQIIHRTKKNGRGGACIEGFKSALAEGFEYIFEMDADFSHDPVDIPRLLNKVRDGYDMVIGSRYVKGSKIVNWGIKRTIFSKFANIYARAILWIPIHDYTNGYRCYTKKAMEAMDFDKIEAAGYIVLSEMSYQLHKKGLKIGEIPITFVNRRRGISNLSRGEIISAFTNVLRLKWDYMWGEK
ncbi:MAG: group 2 family glycosyltransferase, dolichol-phosphate mannosyltransferase [Candidatus Peregrinibacteria bacterium GW2011_GWF2_43_17]|nr:MAG: group 2 family glycosyltransferase, dolichol-phosphate mannosyltransferase [Candidatus Peregrinibacteria bacterium GW2011_GWF2_43_17]KKT19643.1 MAG: Glycosyltransferase, group 2 family protein [Candidatus Peregrinibacteria bacterium GW2011_GWA2_43_8]HAU40065.1 dolichyl-phosphate beta-D-mannosyltransferase [Candidatus Peregrinibacteria bacterium]